MILTIDRNTVHLILLKAKSRIVGYFQLSYHPNKTPHAKLNRAMLVERKTLRYVVSSATEAETARVFFIAQTAMPMQHVLESIGHPQPPTPFKTEKSTTVGFINNNMH